MTTCVCFGALPEQFTLDTNRLPPALPALFDDMFQQPGAVCSSEWELT